MATSSSTSAAGLSSLTNLLGGSTSSSPLQITGLASGLDTNSIVSELMSIASAPVTALQKQQTSLNALNTALTSVQSALNGVVTNAQALSSVSLYQQTQSITSSDSTLVSATATNGLGAVVGGYQVAVTTMASAAQATYSFTSQSTPNTITVTPSTGGTPGTAQTYNLGANATAQDLVNAVNADSKGSVWGTVVNGNIVFSDRTTGAPSTFTVSDSAGTMALQGTAKPGVNAAYSINGIAQPSSPSNTVTNAIPGVTLTFGGVTSGAGGGAVNVNVGAPNISTSQIESAVQTFITSYNAVVDQINGQLSQAPSKTDPTVGQLYGDTGLSSLLSNMRQAMYSSAPSLPAGMSSLLNIGISTGAATGSATPNQGAISGHLTLNTSALEQAIQSNPSGVVNVLKSFSANFANLVNAVAQPGGTLDSRIQGDNSQVADLGNQIAAMQSALADKQKQLQQQFAALEGALSQNQSTSSWLTTQLNNLVVP